MQQLKLHGQQREHDHGPLSEHDHVTLNDDDVYEKAFYIYI
jgi:hypothetical protein